MKVIIRKSAETVIPIVAALVIWFILAVVVSSIKHVNFPDPIHTIERLTVLLNGRPLYDHTIMEHTVSTLIRWGTAYILAVVLAVPLAVVLASVPFLYRSIMPLLHLLHLIPGLAWIPVAMLLFGLGTTSTLFMIFVQAFIPIVVTTVTGFRTVNPLWIKTARMMGASPLWIFRKVQLPATMLPFIDGLRIGLAGSWRVLVAAEMVIGTGIGLGYAIYQSRWSLDYEAAFASLIVIAAIGWTIEKAGFGLLEKWISSRLGMEHHHD